MASFDFFLIILIFHKSSNPAFFVFNRYIVCLGLYANRNGILSWFYAACTLGALNERNEKGQEMLMCHGGLIPRRKRYSP